MTARKYKNVSNLQTRVDLFFCRSDGAVVFNAFFQTDLPNQVFPEKCKRGKHPSPTSELRADPLKRSSLTY